MVFLVFVLPVIWVIQNDLANIKIKLGCYIGQKIPTKITKNITFNGECLQSLGVDYVYDYNLPY